MSDKYEGLGLSEEEISAMEEELGEDTGVETEADDAEGEHAVLDDRGAAVVAEHRLGLGNHVLHE